MSDTKTHEIVIDSPYGHLVLGDYCEALTYCHWSNKPLNHKSSSVVLKKAKRQLIEYFQGKRTSFDVPLAPKGTDFQQAVWQSLLSVPYGETRSYQAIAKRIGNPLAVRAVGSANGKNPLCIFIPCHRVIRASGTLGGYSGGIEHKIQLLELEQEHIPQVVTA